MSRKALIVGINSYQHLPDLTAPALDAEAIAQRLEKDGGFSTLCRLSTRRSPTNKNQPLGLDRQVTREQLEQALKQLFWPNSQQVPDTALFYFSGHSIPEHDGYDKGYLAASDTNPNQSRSGLSLGWLQWLLSESPVKQQIIWLDCCHSGSIFGQVEAANPRHGEHKNCCFIASSRDFKKSWQDLNHANQGLTQALLDGLESQRIPGQWINTTSLIDYVNQALKGDLQTPICTNIGEAINLTSSKQVQADIASPSQTNRDICPYKGRAFFDCNDEDPQYFFGREQLVGQLLDRVQISPFIALVGAAGHGKSSVLRAGLLHQLKLGRRITGSNQWQIQITRPGHYPLHQLALAFVEDGLSTLDRAEALGRVSGLLNEGAAGWQRLVQGFTTPRTILVIDSFEEVFTHCENLEERDQFFACLMGALSNADDRLCLVIAMGSDFVVNCHEQEYSGLAQQIDQHRINLLPMQSHELEAAICKPAKHVNLHVEPALVQTLLQDIEGIPDHLPLLQSTLEDLWQQHQGNPLTLASYQARGGLQRPLDQRASAIDNKLDETDPQIVQPSTQLSEANQTKRQWGFPADWVARPQPAIQLVQPGIEDVSSSANRPITTREVRGKADHSLKISMMDVSHEALMRHWQLLRHWMNQGQNLLSRQRQIETSTIAWRHQNQHTGYFLPKLPLTEVVQVHRNQSEIWSVLDHSKIFIQKSLEHSRWRRIKTRAGLLVPALVLLVVAEHSMRERGIKQDYARLHSEDIYEERQAVEGLVQVCKEQKEMSWLPGYLAERLLGHCRPLFKAPLGKANLISTDLSSTDLRSANLRGANLTSADIRNADLKGANLRGANLHSADIRSADLRGANLYSADLRGAYLSGAYLHSTNLSNADFISTNLRSTNLRSANLINADLSSADLSSADLRGAILLKTNLRETKNLLPAQLAGEYPPFICHAQLPQGLKIDRNRDCDKMASILRARYPQNFSTLKQAEQYVQGQRQGH